MGQKLNSVSIALKQLYLALNINILKHTVRTQRHIS